MNITEVSINQVKLNPNNPRTIRDEKFAKLVQSIKEFPEMLQLRPIVVNDDMIVLGGNMRLKACKEAGLKKVPIIKASDLTEDQQREFIIKDNVGFGEWDWAMLANEWDQEQLGEWGLEVWKQPDEIDYSVLEESDITEQLDEMADGVKKSIQIEFNIEDYEEAVMLAKECRARGVYLGGLVLQAMKNEAT